MKRIFREYLEGASFRDIAMGLERDHIKTGGKRYKWHIAILEENILEVISQDNSDEIEEINKTIAEKQKELLE